MSSKESYTAIHNNTMYKQLIYAVTAMLIGGAAYYFHLAGVPSLVVSAQDNKSGNGVSAMQVFSGMYICTELTGCKNITRLILEEDTTLDIIAVIDGQESSLGQGTWGVGAGGAIVMKLRNTTDSSGLNYPTSLIANKVSSMRITGFSKKMPLFEGMESPIFTRINGENQNSEQVTENLRNGE